MNMQDKKLIEYGIYNVARCLFCRLVQLFIT